MLDMFMLMAAWYVYIFRTNIEGGPVKSKNAAIVLLGFLLASAIHSLGLETSFKGLNKLPQDYTYNYYKSELCSAAFDEIFN